MQNTKENYLKGFYKNLALIALPIIMQNLLQTFINMLDTIMVGQLGSIEIAAVGLGNQIFFMLNMVVFGVSSGGSIFITQFWGKRDFEGIKKTTGFILSSSLAVSLIFMAFCLSIPDKIIALYSKDSAVIASGASYLKAVAICYPFFAASFCFQMAFRSTEHVYFPTVCTAISMLLNLICNYLFIFGMDLRAAGIPVVIPRLGVVGAGVGTVISRTVECFIVITYSYAKKFEVCGKFSQLMSFKTAFVIKLLKIALPVLVSETLWGLGITIQNGIYARSGTEAIAAFNITNTISQLTWVFFIGVGSASSILIGKRIGASQNEAAKAYAHRFCWFLPVMGIVLGSLLLPLSFLLPKIFNVAPSVISIAQTLLMIMIAIYPLRAFNMLIIVGICRAGGDTVFSMLLDNCGMWLLSIPLALVAAFVFHVPVWGIFLCLETEQLLKSILGAFRVKSGKWLRNVTE